MSKKITPITINNVASRRKARRILKEKGIKYDDSPTFNTNVFGGGKVTVYSESTGDGDCNIVAKHDDKSMTLEIGYKYDLSITPRRDDKNGS